jgi:hypothetical protein
MTAPELERPAFYALRTGGWRDLITLLHPPYTAWHLSYVAIGAAAAPALHGDRLAAALGAFFLGVGVCAHALDELNGRSLGTALSDRTLVALAAVGLVGAVGIGLVGVVVVSVQLAPLVAAGGFIVVAYNLELFGGRFHSDTWFALAWGAFPAFTSYWANALELRPAGVLVTAACFALSAAQRRLSTPARDLRRRTVALSGEQQLADGRRVELSAPALAAPLEGALSALSIAMVLLAAGLVAVRS